MIPGVELWLQRGFSPLMCACSLEGTAHLVRVLIRKGANIHYAAVSASPCSSSVE